MKRQLKILVLSTEVSVSCAENGINSIRHTCPRFPQNSGLYYNQGITITAGLHYRMSLTGVVRKFVWQKLQYKQKGFVLL